MEIVRFRHEGLGNTAYLVEVGPGRAVAIDQDRRIGRQLETAAGRGWDIVASLDTHVHADFVTGSLELRARAGAEVYLPEEAGAAFPHRGVTAGQRLEIGDVEVEALPTPGHTPEHLSFVVRGADGSPPALFSGGALMAGGAARTDLISPDMTEQLTRDQFRTLHRAFESLPDETALYPTHGGGSFCSVGTGDGAEATTLGAERGTNPLIAMRDEDEFVRWWPTTFPGAPSYFFRLRAVNLAGPRLVGEIPPPVAHDPAAFERARADGALVVDVREPEAYAAGHVPGSLAIHFRDAFATWLGWLAPADASLLLVTDGAPLDRVVEEAQLVGYERVVGYLDGGLEAWRAGGLPVSTLDLVDADRTHALLADGAVPLDVREPDEWDGGTIAGATTLPLGGLEASVQELPSDRPILTYCSAGERSVTAASILEQFGIEPVATLAGGYGAWRRAGRD
jgi:rhodanese-related sulfurtransferase/glyoxylase-like metal-dependent hydrolase (beta-lactamase superfamily II)